MDYKRDAEMKYTPKSAEAHEVVELMRAYDIAFARAKAAADALAIWSLAFLNLEPGIIVEANKRLSGTPTIFVPGFTMRNTFTGWKGHPPRMLVEEVQIVNNKPLVHLGAMQVQLIGAPIKSDDTPFKGASCYVTLDILDYASTVNFREEAGYAGYFRDTMARYVDKSVDDARTASAPPA
jgi:hypothetical protein